MILDQILLLLLEHQRCCYTVVRGSPWTLSSKSSSLKPLNALNFSSLRAHTHVHRCTDERAAAQASDVAEHVFVCKREWTLLIMRAGEHFCIDPHTNGRLQARYRLLNHNSILVRHVHVRVHACVCADEHEVDLLYLRVCPHKQLQANWMSLWICLLVKAYGWGVGGWGEINTNDILILSVPAHHFLQRLCLLDPWNVFISFHFFLWVDAGTLNDSRLNFWTWLKACREGGGGTVHYANEGPLKDRTLHEDMRVRGATVEFKGRLLPNQFLLHPSLWQPPPPIDLEWEEHLWSTINIPASFTIYVKKRWQRKPIFQEKTTCSFWTSK